MLRFLLLILVLLQCVNVYAWSENPNKDQTRLCTYKNWNYFVNWSIWSNSYEPFVYNIALNDTITQVFKQNAFLYYVRGTIMLSRDGRSFYNMTLEKYNCRNNTSSPVHSSTHSSNTTGEVTMADSQFTILVVNPHNTRDTYTHIFYDNQKKSEFDLWNATQKLKNFVTLIDFYSSSTWKWMVLVRFSKDGFKEEKWMHYNLFNKTIY